MRRAHLIISGTVQGVFFRHSTNRLAQGLCLKGFVRNLSDGTVEVVAEGEESALRELISFCRKGPEAASVSSVAIKWEEPSSEFTTFSIRY